MEKLTEEQLIQFEELISKKIGVIGSPERIAFEQKILEYQAYKKQLKYKKPNPYFNSKRKFK